MEEFILTDHGKKVLQFMQENDQIFAGKDLGELIGIKGIYPVLNSLKRKSLIHECEPVMRNFKGADGSIKLKEYKTYELTEVGRAYILIR